MTDFSYRLVVLTHGASSTLEACLRSFSENATPAPAETVIVVDGPSGSEGLARAWAYWADQEGDAEIRDSPTQQGFCKATARAWAEGAKPGVDYVFYLEHDFEFNRAVDLQAMAAVLDRHPELAQMVCLRQAVNEQELAAGGLMEARDGEFTPRSTLGYPWASYSSFFSTNPSLMTREFMAAHPFPTEHEAQCEGLFGWDLRELGYSFGMWTRVGDEPLVNHIGVRDGSGHSY